MTRRLTLAILGTTVAALLLAGLATLLLARGTARGAAEADLRGSAEAVAGGVTELPQALRSALRRALRLDGVEILVVGPLGRVNGTLPDGLDTADLRVEQLLAGATISGAKGDLVFAAAPASVNRSTVVVVLTREVSGFGPATGWFMLAAVVTIALSALVAVTLGRRLTRPIREADDATRRIAAGELSTRLAEPAPGRNDELADLARSVNVMAENLERLQALEQQFLLSISHDLRTPLTSIRGYAEAIQDGVSADARQSASVILAEARRLDRLVADLLDLARLQSRSFSLHLQPVDLVAVCAATVAAFAPTAGMCGVSLEATGESDVWIAGDPDRLAQVVANLVENALRHARATVTVSTTVDGGHGALRVDDDGPGIAAVDLPHVFERLYVARHDPTREESQSGLGLAIVRELVAAMGGTVRAEARPAGGTSLIVRFPPPARPLEDPRADGTHTN